MLLGEKGSALDARGIAFSMSFNSRRCQVAQHGQVLKLSTRRRDGKAPWAYRYRVNGSCSRRPQVGGFVTREEAERALRRELALKAHGGSTRSNPKLVEAESEESMQPELKVTKSILVDVGSARAFEFFLDQQRWWPPGTHHMAESPGETVVLEPFIGGRWYERAADGSETEWG
jgi:hypothetical protein